MITNQLNVNVQEKTIKLTLVALGIWNDGELRMPSHSSEDSPLIGAVGSSPLKSIFIILQPITQKERLMTSNLLFNNCIIMLDKFQVLEAYYLKQEDLDG